MSDEFLMKPIGFVKTDFKTREGMPIQGLLSPESEGVIVLKEYFAQGLRDLEGFSHAIIIYCFHLSEGYSLLQKPFLDECEHGVFSIRSPRRPNPIGMTVVEVKEVGRDFIRVSGVDAVDGTPVLDIKPYIPEFDSVNDANVGWIRGMIRENAVSDSRFSDEG